MPCALCNGAEARGRLMAFPFLSFVRNEKLGLVRDRFNLE